MQQLWYRFHSAAWKSSINFIFNVGIVSFCCSPYWCTTKRRRSRVRQKCIVREANERRRRRVTACMHNAHALSVPEIDDSLLAYSGAEWIVCPSDHTLTHTHTSTYTYSTTWCTTMHDLNCIWKTITTNSFCCNDMQHGPTAAAAVLQHLAFVYSIFKSFGLLSDFFFFSCLKSAPLTAIDCTQYIEMRIEHFQFTANFQSQRLSPVSNQIQWVWSRRKRNTDHSTRHRWLALHAPSSSTAPRPAWPETNKKKTHNSIACKLIKHSNWAHTTPPTVVSRAYKCSLIAHLLECSIWLFKRLGLCCIHIYCYAKTS